MSKWDIRRLSVGLVLGVEAAAGVAVHELKVSLWFVLPGIVIAVVGTAWLLDSGVERSVRKWNRAANWFGARLGSGQKVHGWWYSKIYADDTGDGDDCELLGGSVVRIIPTIDSFMFSGDAYVLATGEWTTWGGSGLAYNNTDEVVYRYWGREAKKADDGFGLYAFYGGDPPESFNGGFYGHDLRENKHRSVEGERCPAEDAQKFAGSRQERRACLLRYLELEAAAPADGHVGLEKAKQGAQDEPPAGG